MNEYDAPFTLAWCRKYTVVILSHNIDTVSPVALLMACHGGRGGTYYFQGPPRLDSRRLSIDQAP